MLLLKLSSIQKLLKFNIVYIIVGNTNKLNLGLVLKPSFRLDLKNFELLMFYHV